MDVVKWFNTYVMSPDKLVSLGGALLKVIFIFIVARIVIHFVRVAIEKMFRIRSRTPMMRHSERREATLTKLCQNIAVYIIYFIAALTALEAMGIDIKALLAGVSIVGLAVGFGAQNLVKDIVTGFFIIFEDQFSVGDLVKINDTAGTVEEVGLRITKLKAPDGEVFFFANSAITKVANYTLGGKTEIPVPESSS
ncbi:mechanosensitive ion channel [Ectobacillus antri]|jgi:small-conductance mechanosensitive channel|uniref:Mechanosensitive ion channel n=1 Tax=Ectobacillus antri TaxID=2486280 RepID=A0ABT6H4I4_9BACI|nr:mechanosensitive ion channel domain-containing protein [Ectobacillus antri]MDG4656495.1 mechanosensitive ion channel [Ectobacillus antri]MDG5753545.1 mechanosensitive ion channel [Ectobacillus antri]